MKQGNRTKTGRNQLCQCGSGRKYKRCHGSGSARAARAAENSTFQRNLAQKIEEMKALQAQREKQQGLGKPIISATLNGYRLVVIGNTVKYSNSWQTFHDFLFDYIRSLLGSDWGNAEIKKPLNDRHPILQWYDAVCRLQRETIKEPGKVHSGPMNGAAAAYLGLAYNLYLLAHNVEVQSRLLQRLKNPNDFRGALYETHVAALLIKSGFFIEFENEADGSTTHCEFTATHRRTKRCFSVEAKARMPGKNHVNTRNQLHKALSKAANHERLVFIDLNVPSKPTLEEERVGMNDVIASIRKAEENMTIDGVPAPPAYVFITNYPAPIELESTNYHGAAILEGFKIPDFKVDTQFASLRDALASRERHMEVLQIGEMFASHGVIPSTFDGEIPEFAFGSPPPRLLIGQQYAIELSGRTLTGVLQDAVVSEPDKEAIGILVLDDGQSIIYHFPLSDEELSAYRRHPDTFFGIYKRRTRSADDPLALFDFFYEAYRDTPRTRILELMNDSKDIKAISKLNDNELRLTYCERLVYGVLRRQKTDDG